MRIKKILTVISFLLVASLLMGAGCWIVPINRPPEITSTPVKTATVGEAYTYDVDATDPDTGDVLTYSLISEPTGMVINGDSGLITWTPTAANVGNVGVTVEVTDDGGLSDIQGFIITVSLVPVMVTDVTLNETFLYLEAGGNPVTLLATVAPANATNKSVNWSSSTEAVATVALGAVTPVAEGTTTITVTTVDGSFTDTCEVIVSAVPMEITVELPEFKVGKEVEFTVNIVANDDAGKMVRGYFTLPEGDYQIVSLTWLVSIPLLPGTSYIAGPPEGYSLEDETVDFKATFNSAGTYSMTIEVKTTGGDLLCSKDITIVVEELASPTYLHLNSVGDSTAEWTTDESYSGSYSAKLIMKGGWWNEPNNNAEVQIFIAGNPKIKDINSWSYYFKTAYPDYKTPVELNLDTDGDGEIDKVLYATDAEDATGDWEEWNQDTGHWWYGPGSPDNWAELQSWVAEHYPNATLVRVDLGYGPLGSNQEIIAYVDDFTIDGTTYELEPN